nr:hypothetical protein [Yersinia pestis]
MPQQRCSAKYEGSYPMELVLQLGSKRMNPDELTHVSDSGE